MAELSPDMPALPHKVGSILLNKMLLHHSVLPELFQNNRLRVCFLISLKFGFIVTFGPICFIIIFNVSF